MQPNAEGALTLTPLVYEPQEVRVRCVWVLYVYVRLTYSLDAAAHASNIAPNH